MTNATKTERPSPNVIDAKTFWRTLGERAIGATIVTAQGADGPAGLLGLSATHVCADPPSMLVSIDRKTSALAAVLQDLHGLAVLALLGPGDELVAPAHDLADVGKAEELELADDLLDRHLGALSPGAHDLRDAGLNPNIS